VPTRAELTLGALGLIQHTQPDTLARVAESRGVTPGDSWSVYDVARALIEPGAVWRQLGQTDKNTLQVLESCHPDSGDTPVAVDVSGDLAVFVVAQDPDRPLLRPDVRHAIDTFRSEWRAALDTPRAAALEKKARRKESATAQGTNRRHLLSQALPRIIDSLEQLCQALDIVSTTEITSKSPQVAPLVKALDNAAPDMSADWAEAVDWGVWAGLLHHTGAAWWADETAPEFCGLDHADQLARLVDTWWNSAPPVVHEVFVAGAPTGGAETITTEVLARYPLVDVDWFGRWVERGKNLGVFTATHPTALVDALTTGASLTETITPLLPPFAPGLYLDGVDSVVAAGPVTTAQRDTLKMVARCIRTGMTPRWILDRDVTLTSLTHTSAHSLITALDTVIIGGVPPAMATHIGEWESRAKALTLTRGAPGAVLTCLDDYLGELLMVDQKLALLRLARQDTHTLTTERRLEEVRTILLDAGYPTFPALDLESPQRLWSPERPPPVSAQWWEGLVTSANTMASHAVWWEEVLRDAIAERTTLSLCVRVGDKERWMDVEPKSVSTGRLRVKDTAADVERTLPLELIIAIDLPKNRPEQTA
jgi:hypothetical protein